MDDVWYVLGVAIFTVGGIVNIIMQQRRRR